MLQNYHFLPIWNKNIVYLYKRKVYWYSKPPDFSKVKVIQLSCNVTSHKLRLTLLILHLPNGFALVVETYTLNQGGGSVDGVTNRNPIFCLGGFAILCSCEFAIRTQRIRAFVMRKSDLEILILIAVELQIRQNVETPFLQLCNFVTLQL